MEPSRDLYRGLKVGLLGGSFNPPHQGHLQLSLTALRRMQLDYVWWLVTPGNPLKDPAGYAPYAARFAACEDIARHPRIVISGFEARHGLTYTAETLNALILRYPDTHFVWMMGADNLQSFHQWQDWRKIAGTMPLAVFNRPGARIAPLTAPAAEFLGRFRLPPRAAPRLSLQRPPAWIFFPDMLNPLSSTMLRGEGQI